MNVEEVNRKKYVVPGGSSYMYRARNAVFISPSNSVRHELAKALGAYLLRKYGDIKFTVSVVDLLRALGDCVNEQYKDWPKEKTDFITEAVPKVDKDRRVDLVSLRDEVWYEFETSKKVKKEGSVTIYI